MKLNKTLLLLLLVAFTFSCSEDSTEDSIVSPEGQFDNSRLGEYKGLFTTVDGLTRGSMDLNLSTSNEGTAKITLSTGEVIEMKSASFDTTVNNLRFSSEGLSSIDATFDFSVEDNGLNPMVTNVSFDNKESDILIAKNLSRAPATTLTGTYNCTNCSDLGVGFPNGRTWNVMTVGAGNNQTYSVQIAYFNRVYTTTATQNGCAVNPLAPTYTTCTISGSEEILGFDLTFAGQHSYPISPDESCSYVTGTWSAPGYGPGAMGEFTSAGTENSCF